MIANTDDHLRNHGFIYERYKGWRLSPAYDINPVLLDIKPRILSTSIDFDDNEASIETALDIAKDFRLSLTKALEIIKEVETGVQNWCQIAINIGLSKSECDRMASAFEFKHNT